MDRTVIAGTGRLDGGDRRRPRPTVLDRPYGSFTPRAARRM